MENDCIVTTSDGTSEDIPTAKCINRVGQYIKDNKEFYIQTAKVTVIEYIDATINENEGIKMSSDYRTIRALQGFVRTSASSWLNTIGDMAKGGAALGGGYGVLHCAVYFGDNFINGQKFNPVEWGKDAVECAVAFGLIGATVGGTVGVGVGVTAGVPVGALSGAFSAYQEANTLKYHYVPDNKIKTKKAEL